MKLFVFLVALLFASCALAQDNSDQVGDPALEILPFCLPSTPDPTLIPEDQFYFERTVLENAIPWFLEYTRNLDMNNNTVLDQIGYALRARAASDPIGPGGLVPQGYTVTRSSGWIITDASAEPPTNVGSLDNHGTRYEFQKASLCRDHGAPIIFNEYFIPTRGGTFHFYAKPLQTGLGNNWYGFRLNYQNTLINTIYN